MFGHEFKSIIELMAYFDTEEKCITYLEELRWMNGVVSPYDPTSKVYNDNPNSRGYQEYMDRSEKMTERQFSDFDRIMKKALEFNPDKKKKNPKA